jgi:hypothetical protein
MYRVKLISALTRQELCNAKQDLYQYGEVHEHYEGALEVQKQLAFDHNAQTKILRKIR